MNNVIIQTFAQSDIVGKVITLAILALSVFAWFVILDKVRYLRAAERNSKLFLHQFHVQREHILSLRFGKGYAQLCPLYRVYEAGVKELRHHLGEADSLETANPGLTVYQLEGIEEALGRAVSNETGAMESMLIVLALSATVGPLMGLLGTVWGIMNAFNSMAAAGSPSLLIVAPGIAGALITTVIGLLVAIPSLAAYNLISNRIKRMVAVMDDFASEFLSLIGRRLIAR